MARSIDAEIKALLKEATKQIEQAQRSDAKKVVTGHTTQRGLFRRRVRRVWGRAIDELTHLVLRCRELGGVSVQDRSVDPTRSSARLFVGTRLPDGSRHLFPP